MKIDCNNLLYLRDKLFVDMRLKSLSLKNMRLFGEAEQTINFREDKNVTIIVGNNSTGKSSILDSISIQISSLLSHFPGQSVKQYQETDVHIDENGKQSQYLNVKTELTTTYNGPVVINRSRKGAGKASETDLKQAKHYADLLMEMVNNPNQECILPLVAYYGTGRGQIQAPERKRGFQKVFSRWDAYKNTLESSTNFKRFFEWFDLMEDEERREQVNRKDFEYRSPVLETVRKALSIFIGDRFTNPHIELKPLRFVMEETAENGQKRQLRIEQMSDGYKIITAMVADIASRMAEANPDMEDALLTPGIVLVDEIDLHLHPKWQRKIIDNLTKTFPNVQFVVTTHSPIILLGAMGEAQMIVLDNQEIKDVTSSSFSTYDVSQILLSDLFGLQSSRAPQWDDLIREQEELLSKHNLSDEEQSRLKDIEKQLSALSYGDTLKSVQSRDLIYKIAEQLGIN